MTFIKKGWGQDIATLSNMAEAITNLAISNPKQIDEYSLLINEVVKYNIKVKDISIKDTTLEDLFKEITR